MYDQPMLQIGKGLDKKKLNLLLILGLVTPFQGRLL